MQERPLLIETIKLIKLTNSEKKERVGVTITTNLPIPSTFNQRTSSN